MRYTPLAAAISLFVAVSASSSYGQASVALPAQAAALLADGRSALASGDLDSAADRFEAALVLAPGSAPIYLALGDLARGQGLQGKAIHYFRKAQVADPANLAAIAGEGAAMAEKGATAKAQRTLAKLQSMCGTNCAEATQLAAVIARGPLPQVKSAQAAAPAVPPVKPEATSN